MDFSEAEDALENGPKELKVGLILSLVGFFLAALGATLVFFFEIEMARYIVGIGIVTGGAGVLVGNIGILNKRHTDKIEHEKYMERYENPKQPWE